MSRHFVCKICQADFYYTVAQFKKQRYTNAQIANTLRESHDLAVRTEDVVLHLKNCHKEKTTSKTEATLIKRLEKIEKKVEVKRSRGRPKKVKKPSKREIRVNRDIDEARVEMKAKLIKKLKSEKQEIDDKDLEPVKQIEKIIRKQWERLRLHEESEVLNNDGNPLPSTRQEIKDLSINLFNYERLLMDKDVKVTEIQEKQAQIQQMTINVLAPMTDIKKLPEGFDPMKMVQGLVKKLSRIEEVKALPQPERRIEGLAE